MERLLLLAFCYSLISLFLNISIAFDTIVANQSLRDGQTAQTLVSSGQRFELGFFSPGDSKDRYLGIWYKNMSLTVVWVANRNNPITDQSGVLTIRGDGNLVLLNQTEGVVWSSNSTRTTKNPVGQLLDSGNLVLKDETGNNSENYIWESFDYPSDTLLPTMKLGWNLKTGLHRYLTSWNNANDPSAGDFSFSLDPPESPQLVLRKGSQKQYRAGPWDGVRFSGTPELKTNPVFSPVFMSKPEEVYYTFEINDNSILSRFVVSQFGLLQYLTWSAHSREWVIMVTLQRDSCDTYGMCGAYGTCNVKDPNCKCLKGFTPKSPNEWNLVDWSSGCIRKSKLDCGTGEGFVKYTGLKLPDKSHVRGNKSMSRKECEAECLKDCSCMAYSKIDLNGDGSDCAVWFEDLIDIRQFTDSGDTKEELYIRMARSELDSIANTKRKKLVVVIIVIVMSTVLGMLLLATIGWFIIWKRRTKRKTVHRVNNPYKDESGEEDLELPLFDLVSIAAATNNFSIENKIGEGGFGPVYKGELPKGKEIAVKRLSQSSGQGLVEFKNEVILIAKLQHRNLVKLLGCCIQGEERMLVYEYMPNKSLDYFIFDQNRRKLLSWQKRFDIVMGIARGLLYLHQDSRLIIIHRDLKTSNILLDSEMIPKISDFGIARIFGGDHTEEKTKRIIGTYGYMSPEYAISGHFSVKSDVFSFGVLLLEIISGQRNRGFCHPDHDLSLIGHAWKLWIEGNPLELIDELMENFFPECEVLRCIQVGLLCVQQRPEDRPPMSSVIIMLGNERAMVPQPKQPGFYSEISSINTDFSSSGNKSSTVNDVSITVLDGR